MSGEAVIPGSRGPQSAARDSRDAPAARDSRAHATSKATRLLSAGTYLDPVYRKSVIKELLTDRFRIVAPSYGYDAVPVLAHALAAHNLRRQQLTVLGVGATLTVVLMSKGVLNPFVAILLIGWLAWATDYLRRIATLQTLMTRLKETRPDGGFDGTYPLAPGLTDELIRKIDHEQSSGSGIIFYSGYHPFVGAGKRVHNWSNTQLLIGAPVGAFDAAAGWPTHMPAPGPAAGGTYGDGNGHRAPEAVQRKPVIPFNPSDLTSYVAARMTSELRDDARQEEQIRALTVERRKYSTAIRTNDVTQGGGWSRLPGTDDLPDIHWREDYDSAREYLCIRIGAWNEELVTSLIVGFDIKGGTLHTEFHTFVLAPLIESFHLVDRLPAALDLPLLWRVARDMTKEAFSAVLLWSLSPLLLLAKFLGPLQRRLPAFLRRPLPGGLRRGGLRAETMPVVDSSEFRLGRYVTTAVDCGARTSVREMATSDTVHHYFQESDAIKYTRIVERRLLQTLGVFLHEHNVDLDDHKRQQNSILQQHFGDNNHNTGPGTINGGDRYSTSGDGSPINATRA